MPRGRCLKERGPYYEDELKSTTANQTASPFRTRTHSLNALHPLFLTSGELTSPTSFPINPPAPHNTPCPSSIPVKTSNPPNLHSNASVIQTEPTPPGANNA